MYLEQRVDELERQLKDALNKISSLEFVLADKSKLTTGNKYDSLAEISKELWRQVTVKVETKSNNELRKEIIQKAKKFVKDNNNQYITFEVDYKNKLITAIYKPIVGIGNFSKYLFSFNSTFATSKCLPEDVFNVHIGKAIALGKLLGMDVSEFTDCVQPDEFVKGHKVYYKSPFMKGFECIDDIEGFDNCGNIMSSHDKGVMCRDGAKIIDDSNAKY